MGIVTDVLFYGSAAAILGPFVAYVGASLVSIGLSVRSIIRRRRSAN